MTSAHKDRGKWALTRTVVCDKALECKASRVGIIAVDNGALALKTPLKFIVVLMGDDYAVISAGGLDSLISETAEHFHSSREVCHER